MPSAVIAAYDYDAPSETLTIRYHSGKVFAAMRSTMVKGVWFNRHIKGKYPFEEVTPGLKQTHLFGPGPLQALLICPN